MPTDDDDCAAWVMDQNRDVRFISADELDSMPESVAEMINIGCLVEAGSLRISSTLDLLFEKETVLLKNGTEELKSLVLITMFALNKLMDDKAMVVYELVQLCRDENHSLWGQACEDLQSLFRVQKTENGWLVNDSIRNIVLSAVTGEGSEMTIGNPQKKTCGITDPTSGTGTFSKEAGS